MPLRLQGGLPVPLLLLTFSVAALAGVAAADVRPEQPAGDAPPRMEYAYDVTGITFGFVHEFAALVSEEQARRRAEIQVELGRLNQTLVAPEPNLETVTIRLGDVSPENPVRLSSGAIDVIAQSVQRHQDQTIAAGAADFYVAPSERDIDPATGADLRPPQRRSLQFTIEYTGRLHQIERFDPLYLLPEDEVPGRPPLDELMSAPVDLVPAEDERGRYYTAWRPGVAPQRFTLAQIGERPVENYSAAAVQAVLEAVRDHLTDLGYMAVHVEPDREAMDRATVQGTSVRLVVNLGVVTEMRTLASGERFDPEERVNHPAHRRIREDSPIQPGVPERNLLRKDELDEYIYLLGRHPGRRVDVAVAPAAEVVDVDPDDPASPPQRIRPAVSLDYVVTENPPLLIYAQISNTGTRQTGRLRQRFGIFHTQFAQGVQSLFGRESADLDDILSLDYQTASFSDVHTFTGSYEAPLLGNPRLRWRVHGLYSEFDASEVGFADLVFTGETWGVGGELIANVFQRDQLFLDVVGGLRYLDISIENFFFGIPITSGQEDFLIPYAGLRLERLTEQASTRGAVNLEWQSPSISSVDQTQLQGLGRLNPDREWFVLNWDLFHSFFLEPVLNPQGFRDMATPETSTLAHEIALGFRGQYAFGNRLIPQFTQVAGGMFTVRGYPESVVAGDTVFIGTAEYRFHLPRALDPGEPGPFLWDPEFRWRPQHVFGRPDWDLTLRAFVDAARTFQHDRLAFERNETLLGTGVGVELSIMRLQEIPLLRNVNLRLDWGFALESIPDVVDSGSSRVHFAATFIF